MNIALDFAYCESATGWLVAQPLNVSSSFALVVLALAWWRDPSARLHRFGLLAVAAGSVVWHGTMHVTGLALDIGSIALWALLWTLDWKRANRSQRPDPMLLALAFILMSGLAGWALRFVMPMWSGAFVPYAVCCTLMAHRDATPPTMRGWWALSAAAIAAAVYFRENDLQLCADVPFGVHWLWHLLAGVSLLGPIRALSLHTLIAPYSTEVGS